MRCFRETPTEGAQVAALAVRAGGTSVTTGRHRSEHRESQPLAHCDLVRESLDSVIDRARKCPQAQVSPGEFSCRCPFWNPWKKPPTPEVKIGTIGIPLHKFEWDRTEVLLNFSRPVSVNCALLVSFCVLLGLSPLSLGGSF